MNPGARDPMMQALSEAANDMSKGVTAAPQKGDDIESELCRCPKCNYTGPQEEFEPHGE